MKTKAKSLTLRMGEQVAADNVLFALLLATLEEAHIAMVEGSWYAGNTIMVAADVREAIEKLKVRLDIAEDE